MAASGTAEQHLTTHFDLGTFEGFNFRHQSAIERLVSAEEVINWDHDRRGEAEFWPSGDNDGVALIFRGRSSICGTELIALDELLQALGDNSVPTFVRIHYVVNVIGEDISKLTAEMVEDRIDHIFEGQTFIDLRCEAAFELFELYYPEEYRVWEKSQCDGLNFDVDRFLDSPCWAVEEVILGRAKFLIVSPQ